MGFSTGVQSTLVMVWQCSTIGTVRRGHVGSLHCLALGGGDGVLYGGAVHLGDGVTVLHLHWDQLDLGVVDTVLGGDLAAGVLHGGLHRVSYGVGGVTEELSVSLRVSLSLSLSLSKAVSVVSWSHRGVTDDVHHVNAERLVLDLLRLDGLCLADVLSPGYAGLSDQQLVARHTVGGGHGEGCGEPKLGVRIRLRCGGSQGGGDKETQAQILIHVVTRDTSHDTSRAEVMDTEHRQSPL